MTHLVTVEIFSLKFLLFLGNTTLRSQLGPFTTLVLFGLGALTMLYYVRLSLSKNESSLFKSSIVLFSSKSSNQIFHVHLLSLMLKVILEFLPTRRQLLNDSSYLEVFTMFHPLVKGLLGTLVLDLLLFLSPSFYKLGSSLRQISWLRHLNLYFWSRTRIIPLLISSHNRHHTKHCSRNSSHSSRKDRQHSS